MQPHDEVTSGSGNIFADLGLPNADESLLKAETAAICDRLAEQQVCRKFYISLANRQKNAAGALVRRFLGWEVGTATGDALKARAARVVSATLSGKPLKPEDQEIGHDLALELFTVSQCIQPVEVARHKTELEMRLAARALPVAGWAESVRGLGELGLAVIIGEAGDLSRYSNPGKLWKRLGLAPLNGKAMSTWRSSGGLTADDWVAAGYSPRRRAEIYSCVGDPLFRQQTMVAGPYRQAYDARRVRTAETHPDWSKGHSHNDALRIMTKQLILDLWFEWRRAILPLKPMNTMPAADPSTTPIARMVAVAQAMRLP